MSETLNLAKVTFVLPDFFAGGAQKVLLLLAEGLDRRVFAPSIVVVNGQGPWSSLVPVGVSVTDLKKTSLSAALPMLGTALRKISPDIVVSTMGYLNLGVLLLKPFAASNARYVVREANALRPQAPEGLKARTLMFAYRFLYGRADRIISPSEKIADELAHIAGLSRRTIKVLRNPVSIDALRTGARPVERVKGKGKRFVCVGRLSRQKAYGRLLDMMHVHDTPGHLTIFGEGPERAALEGKIKTHGLQGRVILAGFNANPAPWVAGADALLLPSLWEGLPNVALEALALGAPVISAPEAGGIGEIAALAKKGAVTLAPVGPEFAHAMTGAPLNNGKMRPSLLPDAFLPSRVNAAFAGILREILATR